VVGSGQQLLGCQLPMGNSELSIKNVLKYPTPFLIRAKQGNGCDMVHNLVLFRVFHGDPFNEIRASIGDLT